MAAGELRQVVPGVHRYVDGLVNWYLVEEDSQLTLVDAGWPRSWSNVEAAVAGLGRSLRDIAAVVLTHAHPDHLGAAEKVRTATGATVHVNRAEIPRAYGKTRGSNPLTLVPGLVPSLYQPSAVSFVAQATLRGFLMPTFLQQASPFDAGSRLDVPGRPVAVATPGHTEGHVSLHLPDKGIVFTGDALCSRDPLTGKEGPRFLPDSLNRDPAMTREYVSAISRLDADLLLFGHGNPHKGDSTRAVEQARAADRA